MCRKPVWASVKSSADNAFGLGRGAGTMQFGTAFQCCGVTGICQPAESEFISAPCMESGCAHL